MKKHFPNFYNWKKVFTFSELAVAFTVIMFTIIGLLFAFLY
ncbi:hypothetical protein SAMN06296241_1351 [Salinimicrobium sediminis]|uniref:Uncharacterized protein n=1 Tax=Salinimicrobium sediminis TaxID=1343891 RepID=A0A285X4X2_9FLAO|nr:hypothetical protein [Salinimicrobium sediminis]SOC79814.1 hypothetical protein SAMN06296241_1351 [Salinimicrobium sediminis]